LKQYGLHRSGTNFLRVILEQNYWVTVHSNEGGWKHGPYELVQRLGRELHCLLCVKDPYAWLVSLHRYRHPENDVAFSEFVRSPLRIVGPDGDSRAIEKPNPARLWIDQHEHWLSVKLASHNFYVFQYEKVLADPEGSIKELVKDAQLKRQLPFKWKVRKLVGLGAAPAFYVPPRQLGALRDHYKKKNLETGVSFQAGYYSGREYLRQYDPSLLQFVNDNLKPELVTRLGYEMVASLPVETEAPVSAPS